MNRFYADKRWGSWSEWDSGQVTLWLREHEHMNLSMVIETLKTKGVKKGAIELGFSQYIASK